MRSLLGNSTALSQCALAVLVACAASATASAQVTLQFPLTPITGHRSYDVSINTAANRGVTTSWLGQPEFFDLTTGAKFPLPVGYAWGAGLTPFLRMAQTVVTTATRALTAGIVYGPGFNPTGASIQLFDLTTPAPTTLVPAFFIPAIVPHDMALARNGDFAAIQGDGGVVWLQLSTGINMTSTVFGGPFTNQSPLFCYGAMVQSVIASDTRAVVLRKVVGFGIIDVYDTTPFPGALPVLINQQVTASPLGSPDPYDLAMSPDKNWVGVMTDGGPVYIVDLGAANTITAAPGPGYALQGIGNARFDAKDTIQLTNNVAVAIGGTAGAPHSGLIGVYDLANPAGNAFFPMSGMPHDLAISPDQKTAAINSSAPHGTANSVVVLHLSTAAGTTVRASFPAAGDERIAQGAPVYQTFPASVPMQPVDPGLLDFFELDGTCWEQEVLESVRLTDTRLAVVGNEWTGNLPVNFSSAGLGWIEFYDTAANPPVLLASHKQVIAGGFVTPDGDVHDLDLSPNGAILGVYGEDIPTAYFKMSDGLFYGQGAATGDITYNHAVDAINLDDTRALCAASVGLVNPGQMYVAIDDTCAAIPQAITTNCPPTATSFMGVGAGSSTSIAANNLTLQCTGVPPQAPGLFFYGPRMLATPVQLGTGGYSCVTGPIQRLPLMTPPGTVISYTLNYATPPTPAGTINVGDTWYFQCWYRDSTGGNQTNVSDALQVTFGP